MPETWQTFIKCLSVNFLVFKIHVAPSFPSLRVTRNEEQDNLKENQGHRLNNKIDKESVSSNPHNKTNTH